ncbi:hypothetical protein HCEG_02201 [Histoplasma capsulatum var. duboisii H88]|uniref:Uncharacterized protein n=1 Tax=Ajellomyces capsulatus (strain H88) TaxID=544711 RepID=F0UB23_AJEC8|nr:hypothetical protein HCEG_02201 [Histoplasma capsulatum var. duboisii H88]
MARELLPSGQPSWSGAAGGVERYTRRIAHSITLEINAENGLQPYHHLEVLGSLMASPNDPVRANLPYRCLLPDDRAYRSLSRTTATGQEASEELPVWTHCSSYAE